MPTGEIKAWLNSSPATARSWMTSPAFIEFVCESQRKAFNMPGRYDGAMSDDCKALFAAEYAMLTEVLEWIENDSANNVTETDHADDE